MNVLNGEKLFGPFLKTLLEIWPDGLSRDGKFYGLGMITCDEHLTSFKLNLAFQSFSWSKKLEITFLTITIFNLYVFLPMFICILTMYVIFRSINRQLYIIAILWSYKLQVYEYSHTVNNRKCVILFYQ